MPTDSNISPVIGQLQLGLPTTTESNDSLTSVDRLLHVSSMLSESVYTAAVYEHEFSSIDPAFASRDLRLASSVLTPRVHFRMGYNESDVYWYPWQEHVLLAHSASPSGPEGVSGHLIAFSSVDRSYEMDRGNSTAARRGKISDIVADLAEENGIDNVVIEPTSGEGVFIQSYTSNAQFIRERLLPRAMNAKGAGGYFFFFKDGALHFHTLDYQAAVKSFDYYGQNGINLAITDRTQTLFNNGVAGTNYITCDPYTGQVKEIESSPSLAPKMAEVLYPTAGVPNGALNRLYHLGQNSPSEANALAQYRYVMARLRSFEVLLTFNGMTDIRIGDVVQLNVGQQASISAPVSGLYYVTEARYSIREKQIMTSVTLNRGETSRITNDTAVIVGGDQLVPALTAPGTPVNLSELDSSTVTKGPESRTSRTVVVPVRDVANG